jgi:hypothetical protein
MQGEQVSLAWLNSPELGLPALDELSVHQKVPSSEINSINRHTPVTERSVALPAPRRAQVPKFGGRISASEIDAEYQSTTRHPVL